MRIGNWIKAWRESQGWSRMRLARELGCSDNAIYRWETDRVLPSEAWVERIHALAELRNSVPVMELKELAFMRFLDALETPPPL